MLLDTLKSNRYIDMLAEKQCYEINYLLLMLMYTHTYVTHAVNDPY